MNDDEEEEAKSLLKRVPGAVKIGINQRISFEGRTRDFNTRKLRLRSDGMGVNQAWITAALEMTPMDGSQHELEPWMPRPAVSGIPEQPSSASSTNNVEDPLADLLPVSPPPEDGGPAAVISSPPSSAGESIDSRPKKRGRKPKWNKPDPPAPPPTNSSPFARFIDPKQQAEDDRIIEQLVEQVDPRKTASAKVISDFVFNHKAVAWSKIPVKRIPCIGAITLLRSVKASEKVWEDFCKGRWGGSKKDGDQESDRFYDDGRSDELLAKAFESLERQETGDDDDD